MAMPHLISSLWWLPLSDLLGVPKWNVVVYFSQSLLEPVGPKDTYIAMVCLIFPYFLFLKQFFIFKPSSRLTYRVLHIKLNLLACSLIEHYFAY